MLDRAQLTHELTKLTSRLFVDDGGTYDIIKQAWMKICTDAHIAQKIQARARMLSIPYWKGAIDATWCVNLPQDSYTTVCVDGSQIYPDRHSAGAQCVLLNAGGVILTYGKTSKATFFSLPRLYMPEDLIKFEHIAPFTTDLVDLKREELEFEMTLAKGLEIQKTCSEKPVCLVDGNLTFWHLENKQLEVKSQFLASYLSYLNQFYKNGIAIAGYISLPRSRELTNIVKFSLCKFADKQQSPCMSVSVNCPCKATEMVLDTHLMRIFLPRYSRTTLFSCTSKITDLYPDHLKPFFFYLDVGKEIARIEIPAWIAQNDQLVSQVASVALDQSCKGNGYPIGLAEAHEQAVVKGADRQFFYHVLKKIRIEQNRRVYASQKSIKKLRTIF